MNSASMFDDDDDLVRVVDAYAPRPPNAAKWGARADHRRRPGRARTLTGTRSLVVPGTDAACVLRHCPADHSIQPQRSAHCLLGAVEDNVYRASTAAPVPWATRQPSTTCWTVGPAVRV